jgi:serine/threonine protein kinase
MRIGSYEILDRIAQGATSAVFKARRQDGLEVAIKVLARAEPEIVARFEREKRLLRLFSEERGFVPMLDSGRSGDGPYIVMPLMPGGTLRHKLMKGPLSLEDTLTLGHEVALALGIAHANGMVHRDMKPENILFTKDGVPLIADLGLAKHFMFGETLSVSQTGAFTGTAGYAAPEQVHDAKSAGPAADVFSLGAILYECLVGVPAFTGRDMIELFRRVAEARHEPLAAKRKGTPLWLCRVIEKALERSAQERFPHGIALAQALEGGEWGQPRKARPIATYVFAPPPPEEGDELDVPPSEATAEYTSVMSPSGTVPLPDTAGFERPPDAPQTLVIQDIPFVVKADPPSTTSVGIPDTGIPDTTERPAPRVPKPRPKKGFLAKVRNFLAGLKMRS